MDPTSYCQVTTEIDVRFGNKRVPAPNQIAKKWALFVHRKINFQMVWMLSLCNSWATGSCAFCFQNRSEHVPIGGNGRTTCCDVTTKYVYKPVFAKKNPTICIFWMNKVVCWYSKTMRQYSFTLPTKIDRTWCLDHIFFHIHMDFKTGTFEIAKCMCGSKQLDEHFITSPNPYWLKLQLRPLGVPAEQQKLQNCMLGCFTKFIHPQFDISKTNTNVFSSKVWTQRKLGQNRGNKTPGSWLSCRTLFLERKRHVDAILRGFRKSRGHNTYI